MDFKFTLEHIPRALEIMGFCMLGIFLVLGIIYGASLLLLKIFPDDTTAQK